MNIEFLQAHLPALLRGALVSIQIGFFGSLIGILGGTFVGILQTTKSKIIKFFIVAYVNIVRGTPMLIQIGLVHYVFFPLLEINSSAFVSAVTAIGLNSIAYISEVIRSGIQSVDKGQIEAAQTLGLSRIQTNLHIVLPQAIRNVIPALGNELITLIKDSSLASTIGVYELLKEGSIVISRTYDALSVYLMVGIIYLIITSSLSLVMTILERKTKLKC
ncbi:amino acid ABC transporter permease [bacterium]|nr:amino acid ABC transporter permease [bacterium]